MLTREPMRTRFILRFDDICPTINWRVWRLLEHDLYELNIKPIMAVIPQNRHQSLIAQGPAMGRVQQSAASRAKLWCSARFLGQTQPAATNALPDCVLESRDR